MEWTMTIERTTVPFFFFFSFSLFFFHETQMRDLNFWNVENLVNN